MGNARPTFRHRSGNTRPTLRQRSVNFPATLSPVSGNAQPTFRQCSARFPATLNPLSGNAQPTLRQRSTHFPAILSPLSGNAAATFLVCKLPRLGRPYGRLIATPTCPPSSSAHTQFPKALQCINRYVGVHSQQFSSNAQSPAPSLLTDFTDSQLPAKQQKKSYFQIKICIFRSGV